MPINRRTVVLALLALGAAAPAVAQMMPSREGRDPNLPVALRYRQVGPSRGGRVTAVAGVPGQQGTYYMGATGGGMWKTTDYGVTWANISDGFYETGSIGAIAVAPSDPSRVYVGTGSDGIRSNIIRGNGVYRSDDAGKTWRHVGLPQAGLIGAVLVHPADPQLVYVAAVGQPFGPNPERGVFRSRDGGATWQRVLFVSDSTGAVDLEFAPDDPRTLYASMWRTERKPWTIISGAREGGVYKSTDGGDTWSKLGGGLPTGLVGKSDLAVSPAAPNRLYVLIEAQPGGALYRSDDRGATFTAVSTQNGLLDRPFYYTNVDADPTNADVVWVSATQFWKSTDGGKTFQRRSTPHGDNHDLWIDPADPRIMIQANDGGANVTRDGGETWSTQENQPTAELYQVAVDDRYPYWLYAGQQDNTTIAVPSLPAYPSPGGHTGFWRDVGGCETGPAVPKPGDPDVVYSNCKGQFGRYSARTGQEWNSWVGAEHLYGANPQELQFRFQRTVPIHVSPHDPNTIYHASHLVHRSRDEGLTWETISPDLTANDPKRQMVSGAPITRDVTGEEYYSTLYSVAESPVTAGVIWAGANDGPVHATRDGGRTWTNVTPRGLPPEGRVQTVAPSPHQAGKAYVSVLRYMLQDWRPYVYRTSDYGATWQKITAGIPDSVPVRVVREDPLREGLLWAGTEGGMYVSFDDGARWQPFQLNLPATPVTDLTFARNDLVLSTMGRGFWILDDRTLVAQLEGGRVDVSAPRVFAPATAIRTRYRTFGGAAGGPEYPPVGAWIDYALPEGFSGPAVLEIRDASDRVVRRLTSAAPAEDDMLAAGTSRIPATPGHHRIRWDLSHPGAWDASAARRGRNGPMVAPGRYRVVLLAGDAERGEPLVVEIDPRVAQEGVTQAQLAEQERVALAVRDLHGRAKRLAEHVKALRAQRPDDATLREAERELITAPITYPRPMLVDQIGYLYSMITASDQPVPRDAHTRLAQLTAWVERVEGALR